ncbi:hypothetical protein Micbo1qcDRAFT_170995 [Microdochium bolleyi]|uniref:Uncharacterized protein n=1 Tax=Microdochium bolleyi TaxID=196109 RepID=A0A136JJH3_9PEZI|nr:hypothetical protein Micbo1qcDRAFT_170995 [Microdochium bolleyi]
MLSPSALLARGVALARRVGISKPCGAQEAGAGDDRGGLRRFRNASETPLESSRSAVFSRSGNPGPGVDARSALGLAWAPSFREHWACLTVSPHRQAQTGAEGEHVREKTSKTSSRVSAEIGRMAGFRFRRAAGRDGRRQDRETQSTHVLPLSGTARLPILMDVFAPMKKEFDLRGVNVRIGQILGFCFSAHEDLMKQKKIKISSPLFDVISERFNDL